ncbi:hypothetical protein GOV05_01345 [Candidatus Woesearchaeota archaeon]|nr:hypothetical protein [Candidatus Woesearchaeota archaeon]
MNNLWVELTYGSNKGKNLILDILTYKYPLSARKIFYEIKKRGESLTYQAVHKFLKELLNKEVLLEKDKEYMINLDWVYKLENHLNVLKSKYVVGDDFSYASLNDNENPLTILSVYREKIIEKNKRNAQLEIPLAKKAYLTSQNNRSTYYEKEKIIDVLKEETKILLLGNSGSGKTTITKYLSYHLAKNSNFIPITFSFKEPINTNFPKIIQKKILEETHKKIDLEIVFSLLKKGSFFFMFDGLNETSFEKRNSIISILNKTFVKYNQNKYLVTCRTSSDPKKELNLSTFVLEDLSFKQVRKILFQQDSNNLYNQFKTNKNLYATCKNPLFLNLAIEIDKRGDLEVRSYLDLYKDYVDIMVYGKIDSTNLDKKLFIPKIIEILSKVAYDNKKEISEITTGDLTKNISEMFIEDKQNIAYEILISSSILSETKINSFEFIHQSIQDYFCALYLSKKYDGKLPTEIIDMIIKSDYWQDIGLFYTKIKKENNLLNMLQGTYHKNKDLKHLFYLSNILIDVGLINEEKYSFLINNLLEVYYLSDEKFYNNWYELNKIFIKIEDKKTYNNIIRFFDKSKNPNARLTNVLFNSNIDIKSKKLFNLLVKILQTSNDPHLLYSVIEVIGIKKDIKYLKYVFEHLSSNDPILLSTIMWVIENIGDDAWEQYSVWKKNKKEFLVDLEDIEKYKEDLFKKIVLGLKKSKDEIRISHGLLELARLDFDKSLFNIYDYLKENQKLSSFMKYHLSYALSLQNKVGMCEVFDHIWSDNHAELLGLFSKIKNEGVDKKV